MRSSARDDVLRVLAENGPMFSRELEAVADVSRETVRSLILDGEIVNLSPNRGGGRGNQAILASVAYLRGVLSKVSVAV